MKIMRNDNAFTGLEAAIVLIAFVVVAAVFSYVVLGAGFFTTQKSQEVVHTGTDQASSSMEVMGNVYGIATTAGAANLAYVKFTVGNTAGGTALDVTKMVVSYADESVRDIDVTYSTSSTLTSALAAASAGVTSAGQTAGALSWGVIEQFNGDGDTLLESGEQFEIGIAVPSYSAKKNVPITINLQPAVGAVFQVKRTIGPQIDKVNILY
jgi:archaeal flagellin N-terminal-like domain